jgi:thioesterase domain-containing protein/acyl carrier protein
VLDPHCEPVLGGMPGELWIGGEGVARGYLDRPALTAERFRPDPYGAALEGLAPGGRLYRTGDRVRLGESGMLEFLGRIDQQVKVRGFRIEPEEIESALVALAGIREAAVKPIERDGEPLRLAAFVVFEGTASGGVSQPMEVKQRLAEELPDYMVPHWIVPIEALPKTASGKIDRRTLPEPLEDRDAAARVAPRTPAEQVLLEIFQELFDRPEIGVEAGFFDLGGDSLLALRLMSRVQDRLNRDLPLTLLFEKSTIAELADALSEGRSAAAGGASASGRVALPLVAVQPRGDEAPFFCVHPAGGNVLCYNPLGQALGIDRPFYGFQAPGLLREREPILGVEALARHYVRALRKKQPAGPVHLGGWSTGGVVAFEMARQLEALGERPATLVLFDTLAPSAFPAWSEIQLMVAFAGSQEVAFPAGGEISLARFASMARAEQLALIAERRRQTGSLAAEAGVEEVVAQWRVFSANVRSQKRYEPQRYGGDLLCFRALERGANADIAAPWVELAAKIDVEEVPGNHESMMFKPHVQVLARRLGQRLAG